MQSQRQQRRALQTMGRLQPKAAAGRGYREVPPLPNTWDVYQSEDTNLATSFIRRYIHFILGKAGRFDSNSWDVVKVSCWCLSLPLALLNSPSVNGTDHNGSQPRHNSGKAGGLRFGSQVWCVEQAALGQGQIK